MPTSGQPRRAGRMLGLVKTRTDLEDGVCSPASSAEQLHAFRLRAPQLLLEPVERGAILERLRLSTARLIVVDAAAGSGKTTALAQWLEHDPRPGVWLQIAPDNNDPLVLVSYLAEAIRRVTAVDPRVARWLHIQAPPLHERILPALSAALLQAQPFLLILDDVHLLTDEGGWEILELLLDALPRGAQLAVGGRTEPRLPLARLQAAGELLQLSSRDLAFDTQEIATLLALRGVAASEQDVAALRAATEGWAAGLQLAVLAGQGLRAEDWLDGVTGNSRAIARYLTSEVLQRQPPHARSFLLRTSILERLSADLCAVVAGEDAAGSMLSQLAHDNVFITALDQNGQWYRYHHLFAELLRNELALRAAGEVHELHGRAAVWYEDHNQTEEAIRHWLLARDDERASVLFCRGFLNFSAQGRLATMFRWLDLFTAEEKLRHPAMILIAGFPAFVGGAQADAWRPLVDAALDLQVGDDPMPWGSTTMRAFQTMLRAAAARDGMTRFAEDAELAATFAAHDEPGVRAGNDSILGAAQWLSGRKAEARRTLRRAVEEGASYNLLALLGALGCLSTMAADDGDWEEAEACATRAAQRLEEEEMGLVNPLVIVPLAEARVLAHNHDPAAEERIRVVVRVMDRPGMIWWLALLTEAILGEIALEQGDFATAARWARSGKRRLEVWPDAGLLGPRLERLERALERACLVEPLTPAERRLLELLPSHMSLGEIAARLWVSRETVKTEIASLYRKLGVHSRSESVAKARDCGLLRQR